VTSPADRSAASPAVEVADLTIRYGDHVAVDGLSFTAQQGEITALQILYSRPFKQRLTEPMLKELEKKLRDNHAAWTEDHAFIEYAALDAKTLQPVLRTKHDTAKNSINNIR